MTAQTDKLSIIAPRFTKSMISAETTKLAEIAIGGDIDPIKAMLYAKAMEETLKGLKENPDYIDAVNNAVEALGKDNHIYGATIDIRSRKSYAFNDAKLQEMEARKAALDVEIKSRQAYLKSITEPTPDPITGEVAFPAEQAGGTTYLTISFDKE